MRKQARLRLEELGGLAGSQLRQALKTKLNLEVKRRVEKLLTKLEDRTPKGELLRTLRAIEVLEHSGTLGACQVLEMLVEQAPDVLVAEQVQAALRRVR